MNFDMVPHVANLLLEDHGLAAKGWLFRWDNARRRAGCCSYRRKVISLSRHYVRLNIDKQPHEVLDTILHEVAHALAGHTAHHGPAWKAVCCQIGARPVACYDSTQVEMPRGKWVATCGGCGKVYHRHKKMRLGSWAWCRKCGDHVGRLTYVLTITPTTTTQPLGLNSATPLVPSPAPLPNKMRGF